MTTAQPLSPPPAPDPEAMPSSYARPSAHKPRPTPRPDARAPSLSPARRPLLSVVCVFALAPLLFVALAALYDRHLDAVIAATHAALVADGKLAVSANGSLSATQSSLPRGDLRRTRIGKHEPPCADAGKPARSLIMVFMGHSGSSAIISELQAHSAVQIDRAEAVDHGELQHNTSAALAFVRDLFTRTIAAGRVPGLKMRPRHIRNDPAGWRALARDFGTRIVWNRRGNVFKQAVGEYSYKRLGDTSVVEGLHNASERAKRCSTGVGCTFRIDDMAFFHHVLTDSIFSDEQIAQAAHMLSRGRTKGEPRVCVHDVPYEDYLYDRRGTMESLYRFLGLPFEDTSPRRFKATKDNMCEVVQNWGEVCRNFYGCFAWRGMMDDFKNGCTCEEMGTEGRYCSTKLT